MAGDVIVEEVMITANHKGDFEFRLVGLESIIFIPKNNPSYMENSTDMGYLFM